MALTPEAQSVMATVAALAAFNERKAEEARATDADAPAAPVPGADQKPPDAQA